MFVKNPSAPIVKSLHSVPSILQSFAAVAIWEESRPKVMHFPMRCFVSESQRGDIEEGEDEDLEERWEVEDRKRV